MHITPQSLGFARAADAATGEGLLRVDYIGRMEQLDEAWAHVVRSLGLRADAAPNHALRANGQLGRRGADEHAIRTLLNIPRSDAPPEGESETATALATALCALMRRERACLGYDDAVPARCVV